MHGAELTSSVMTFDRLTERLEGQAQSGLLGRTLRPADGTQAHIQVPPVLLKALLTEAVAALDCHGISEDSIADGTGEVLIMVIHWVVHSGSMLIIGSGQLD